MQINNLSNVMGSLLAGVLLGGAHQAIGQDDLGDVQDLVTGLLDGVASTPAQRQIANTIGIVCPTGQASSNLQRDCNALVGGVAEGQKSTGASALNQITLDQAQTPGDITQHHADAVTTAVGARLAGLRRGVRGISVSGFGLNIDGRWQSAPLLASRSQTLPEAGAGAVAPADSAFERLGVFINGTFTTGDSETTDKQAGFDFDTGDLTIGVDYRITDRLVLGTALGYTRGDSSLKDKTGQLDGDAYSLTLYGSYYISDQFYVDGSFGYGWNDYEQHRKLRYDFQGVENGTVNQKLSADFDGKYFTGNIGGGYEGHSGAWTYGPVARLQYLKIQVDAYDEQADSSTLPGSGWEMSIDEQDQHWWQTSLGGQASYASSQPWGVLLPQARFEWVHELTSDNDDAKGYFRGDPSRTLFLIPAENSDTDYFTLGAGVSAVFARGTSAYLFYQTVLGYDDWTQHTVTAGLRQEF